jgi:Fe-S-cluster containining protein
MELKQFVPSNVCLSCDGCCRFKEEQSPWRPKISRDEIENAQKQDLLSKIYSREKIDASSHIKTVSCGKTGLHFCSFFYPETNTCSVYPLRPFECQLYPFVLTKKDNQVNLAVHHQCPFVQEKRSVSEFSNYVNYLEYFFNQKEVLAFLRKNPFLAGEYPEHEEELEYLFTIFSL